MKVKVLYSTPIDVAYFSAKTCYSKESPISLVENDTKSYEDKVNFLKKILSTGHHSTVEGVNFTLLIEGVSRSLMAQLTRHRIGVQFSIQSQRYVEYTDKNYKVYIPPAISKNQEAIQEYSRIQEECFSSYKKLLALGIAAEDARYVLPNATYTNITMTINLRALIHLMELRLCSRASLEIRQLMRIIKAEIVKIEPWLAEYLVPTCETHGFCTEHQCCGRKPKLEEVLEDYYKYKDLNK